LPIVPFEFVAGVAAIHPVIRLVGTVLGAGLEVINRQFGAHVTFRDTAVPAAKSETLP